MEHCDELESLFADEITIQEIKDQLLVGCGNTLNSISGMLRYGDVSPEEQKNIAKILLAVQKRISGVVYSLECIILNKGTETEK